VGLRNILPVIAQLQT